MTGEDLGGNKEEPSDRYLSRSDETGGDGRGIVVR
jgi:hypothetical protein